MAATVATMKSDRKTHTIQCTEDDSVAGAAGGVDPGSAGTGSEGESGGWEGDGDGEEGGRDGSGEEGSGEGDGNAGGYGYAFLAQGIFRTKDPSTPSATSA